MRNILTRTDVGGLIADYLKHYGYKIKQKGVPVSFRMLVKDKNEDMFIAILTMKEFDESEES